MRCTSNVSAFFFSSFTDRPATTSLPFEESGSLRDRIELATAIHAPRETARKGGERNIHIYVYVYVYKYIHIYMYIEKRRKHTRMEASHCHEHQSPSLLLFFVQHYHHSSRKAKERIGYAYTLFETLNRHRPCTLPSPPFDDDDDRSAGLPVFLTRVRFTFLHRSRRARIRGNEFRDVTIFYYY